MRAVVAMEKLKSSNKLLSTRGNRHRLLCIIRLGLQVTSKVIMAPGTSPVLAVEASPLTKRLRAGKTIFSIPIAKVSP